mgnify:CR=1 FL=1
MNSVDIQQYPDCDTHNLAAVSYCGACDTFLCVQCIKTHPDDHMESTCPDLKNVIQSKIDSALQGQSLRTQIIEKIQETENTLNILIQKFTEPMLMIRTQSKELRDQINHANQLPKLIIGVNSANPSHKKEFYNTLKPFRPDGNEFLRELQQHLEKINLISSTVLKSFPKPLISPESNPIANIFSQNRKGKPDGALSKSNLPPMLLLIENSNYKSQKESDTRQTIKQETRDAYNNNRMDNHILIKPPTFGPLSRANEHQYSSSRIMPNPFQSFAPGFDLSKLNPFDVSSILLNFANGSGKKSLQISKEKPQKKFKKPPSTNDPLDLMRANMQMSDSMVTKLLNLSDQSLTSSKSKAEIIKILKVHAPKLVHKAQIGKEPAEEKIKEDILNQFLNAQDSMIEKHPLPNEWRTMMESLLTEFGNISHQKIQVNHYFTITIESLEKILKSHVDDSSVESLTQTINAFPFYRETGCISERIRKSIIQISTPELAVLTEKIKILNWIRRLFKRLSKASKGKASQTVISKDRKQNRAILKVLRKKMTWLVYQVNMNHSDKIFARSVWGILAGLAISSRVASLQDWMNLKKVGLALEAKNAFEGDCALLSGINKIVEEQQALKHCLEKLTREVASPSNTQRKASVSLLLLTVKKQRSLNKIIQTALPKPIKETLKAYRTIISDYKSASKAASNEIAPLKAKLSQFPFMIPAIQAYVDLIENKTSKLKKMLNEFFDIAPSNWKSLLSSSGKILELSSELGYVLTQEVNNKIVLVADLAKNPVISTNLRTDIQYKEVIIAKRLVDELVALEPSFRPHANFFKMNIWLSTVRMIKGVLDGKIERLEPLLMPAELREIQKEGMRYHGVNEQSRKDLAEKQAKLNQLINNMEEKLKEINALQDPEEWWWFDQEYLGVIDLTKVLLNKQKELSGKFDAADFDEASWLEAGKIEILGTELPSKPTFLDDFVPELEPIDKIEKADDMIILE